MTGLSEGGRYASSICPISAKWGIKKEVLHEILSEIEDKMNVEWREAIEKCLEYLM